MKLLFSKRVHTVWAMVVLALCAAIAVIWLTATNAPPSNSVLITSSTDTGTSSKTSPTNQTVGAGHTPPLLTQLPGSAGSPTRQSSAQQTGGVGPNSSFDGAIVTTTEGVAAPASPPQIIAVYVSGAVQKPGVYTL